MNLISPEIDESLDQDQLASPSPMVVDYAMLQSPAPIRVFSGRSPVRVFSGRSPVPVVPAASNNPANHNHHPFHHSAPLESRQSSNVRAPQTNLLLLIAQLAQWLIVGSMLLYTLGNLLFNTKVFQNDLALRFSEMWRRRHPEMVQPSFFLFFCIFPMALSVFLMEFLRQFAIRRLTSTMLLRIAQILRRRPAFRLGSFVWTLTIGESLLLGCIVIGNLLVFCCGLSARLQLKRAQLRLALGSDQVELSKNEYLEVVATRFGYNCAFNLSFLFIPVTRKGAWTDFLNVSHANAVRYHKWLGIATVASGLLHGSHFYLLWLIKSTWNDESLPCFNCGFDTPSGQNRWTNVFGQAAMACFVTMAVFASPKIRRAQFPLFYYVHHLFIPGVVFTILHRSQLIWMILPSTLLYFLGRVLSNGNSLSAVRIHACDVLGDDQFVRFVLVCGSESPYRVGQFVYLNIPFISKLQWHPFAIASAPKQVYADSNTMGLTVICKASGEWTHNLVSYVNHCRQQQIVPRVFMDGFYGNSTELYEEYETICLIGGGIGIASLMCILDDFVTKRMQALSCGPEILGEHTRVHNIHLVWNFRELALLEEIHPLLTRLGEMDASKWRVHFHLFLTEEPSEGTLSRRIDYERLLPNEEDPANPTVAPPPPAPASEQDLESSRSRYRRQQPPRLVPSQMRQHGALIFTEAMSFSLPLRNAMYFTVLLTSLVLIFVIDYNGGQIEANGGKQLWPLQRFLEIGLLFLCGGLAYMFMGIELYMKSKEPNHRNTKGNKSSAWWRLHRATKTPVMMTTPGRPTNTRMTVRPRMSGMTFMNELPTQVVDDITEWRHLIHEYDVLVGHRGNIGDLLHQIHKQACMAEARDNANRPIGLFLSASDGLKKEVHEICDELGSRFFDIHEENYEL